VNEQHPEVPVAEIEAFVKENAGKAGPEADNNWATLLKKTEEKWPPVGYVIARGNLTKLLEQVRQQYPDDPIRDTDLPDEQAEARVKRNPNAQIREITKEVTVDGKKVNKTVKVQAGIRDFIDANYTQNKEQRHLTSEEMESIKSLISQVGSMEFLVLAN